MSIQSIARVCAGVPTGGQFAPTAHAPAEVELPAPKALPAWSEDELETDLADALAEWTEQLQHNEPAETSATELLNMDDPAAIADAYGEDRAEFLRGLHFSAHAETYQTFPGNQFEPPEFSRHGVVNVCSGDGSLVELDVEEGGVNAYGRLLYRGPLR